MTKRVMIVEDNELNMKLFNDLLEAQNYEKFRPVMVWKRWILPARIVPISF